LVKTKTQHGCFSTELYFLQNKFDLLFFEAYF